MKDQPRVPLYSRLPEIYRIKDEEQQTPGQLKAYLAAVEEVFGAIHENIEALYHDLFLDTCADWVIPYIGDLLGTSHLAGKPWNLRADVADTVALRRRKGTLSALELLTFVLTQWGACCAELRENLTWNQHLNHQRPDEGGEAPYGLQSISRNTVIRGGTVTLRDPAMLALLDTPFDPFAHLADLKPPALRMRRYNLPNLAVFLWRLRPYRLGISRPLSQGVHDRDPAIDLGKFPEAAAHVACFEVHPLGEPVQLFNNNRFDPDRRPLRLMQVDEAPGAIPAARLTSPQPHSLLAGHPKKYVSINTYDETDPQLSTLEIGEAALQLHLPAYYFPGQIFPRPVEPQIWKIRGANLCAWEAGLNPPLEDQEVAVDPVHGRITLGVDTLEKGNALLDHLLITYTYAAVGSVGAHPESRKDVANPVVIRFLPGHHVLEEALHNIQDLDAPLVIEINDSRVHRLDLSAVLGTVTEDGGPNLRLNRDLTIRAADGQRPIVRLVWPLRFRPTHVKGADADEQKQFDALIAQLTVRLEGLYITRDPAFPAGEPLIARAALNRLEVESCTLNPAGFQKLDGSRAPVLKAMRLKEPYGFAAAGDEQAFNQTPEIILQRTIAGPLFIDPGYVLDLTDTIIDAGSGPGILSAAADHAVSGASSAPQNCWGPPTKVRGLTVFGRMRVESISGRGGIWVHCLEVNNNQIGCLKFSYFAGQGDRLPQHHGCVSGPEVKLGFVSHIFGQPGYGQISFTTDFRIRERGPDDDAMGAFGFLWEAHNWSNLQIRFREFMPIGVRPLLIPVT